MQMACNNLHFNLAYCSNGLYDDLFNMEIIIMEREFTVNGGVDTEPEFVAVDETGLHLKTAPAVLLGHFPLFTGL